MMHLLTMLLNRLHCSHVTMSVVKLLSRIVAPDIEYEETTKSEKKKNQALMQRLHDHTVS